MAKFKNLFIVYWTLALVFLLQVMSGLCSQEEERLVRDLFRGYNKLIRPVQNMTEKVAVSFGLAFIQLINVVSRPTLNISGDLGISAEISLLL